MIRLLHKGFFATQPEMLVEIDVVEEHETTSNEIFHLQIEKFAKKIESMYKFLGINPLMTTYNRLFPTLRLKIYKEKKYKAENNCFGKHSRR